ncbi:AAA family ATPase [Streptosporangium sp. NPDC020072]|uniref:AAA family ATPase n=1 Tax=Streptosporangium sp. NPDC020072 TaxID=3154788 RepID=UPI003414A678
MVRRSRVVHGYGGTSTRCGGSIRAGEPGGSATRESTSGRRRESRRSGIPCSRPESTTISARWSRRRWAWTNGSSTSTRPWNSVPGTRSGRSGRRPSPWGPARGRCAGRVVPGGRTRRAGGTGGREEPETALHPAAAGALFDALTEASEFVQVVITTQSAELLDRDGIDPASVRVVAMENGATVVGEIDGVSRALLEEGTPPLANCCATVSSGRRQAHERPGHDRLHRGGRR